MVMSLIERHPSDALNYVRNVSSFVQQLVRESRFAAT